MASISIAFDCQRAPLKSLNTFGGSAATFQGKGLLMLKKVVKHCFIVTKFGKQRVCVCVINGLRGFRTVAAI